LLLLGFLFAKGALATFAALLMRFPARVAWLAGVGLAQLGEFGFVLTRLAQANGVVTEEDASPLLAAGIISMFLTPLFVRIAPHVRAGERLLAPLERMIGVRSIDEADAEAPPSGHVIIIGFGLAGRHAAASLVACGVPCLILELNSENVRRGKELGLPVYYGDGTSPEALGHAHLDKAQLVVLLMNDPAAAERIVDTIRRVAAHVPVLMRTRYLAERAHLMKTGAREVVAEEVVTAIAIIDRMLRFIGIEASAIDERVRKVREETSGG
jgi:CPA2 family monovalent cation:H+ antiporter-2